MKIDSHLHYARPAAPSSILKSLDLAGSDACCLMAQIRRKPCVSETVDVLVAKLFGNNRIYAYGALDPLLYYDPEKMKEGLVEHVKNLLKCGIDGIKMIEGKPDTRKFFPIPDFDSPYFEPYFKFMEENQIPIVWHVNDPEEFWDINKAPKWAIRAGWTYDETFVNNIDQYRQIENVLERHPNLSVTFAHFFFLSKSLDKLSNMFDKYPNMRVDITPGIELFTNMSSNIDKARSFFKKYSNRILYGTDISIYLNKFGNSIDEKDIKDRVNLCYDFLSKESFFLKGDPSSLLGEDDININCLALEKEDVENIMYKNFLRIHKINHKVNIEELKAEIARQKKRIAIFAEMKGYKKDYTNLEQMEKEIEEYEND